jgi:UDP-glucose 6-dehydrogenase
MTHHLARHKCSRPVLVIVTEWKAIKSPDFSIIKTRQKQPMIFNGLNLFELADI